MYYRKRKLFKEYLTEVSSLFSVLRQAGSGEFVPKYISEAIIRFFYFSNIL